MDEYVLPGPDRRVRNGVIALSLVGPTAVLVGFALSGPVSRIALLRTGNFAETRFGHQPRAARTSQPGRRHIDHGGCALEDVGQSM
ncbi:hypothetical protein GCM10009557_89000 [Virgisporangium ochraceum]|uniref:Uncharacterized protein n=1 Tax=Virgisporangium ochraceum TaxID=65505 RepID=A0A8J4A0J3_9ACTN|nr:hypothetical protein Voc01_066400 [Virgisporangium ochraceum]